MTGTERKRTLVGEYRHSDDVVRAARALQAEGLDELEVYGPAPLDEIEALVPSRRGRVITAVMVGAALFGAVYGYFIQYWGAALDYPINVGGRPLNGWPGFVPSAWEVCALFTVYAGFFAFLVSSRLPRLHHPIFAVPHFERATQDRFFLSVSVSREPWDLERARRLLVEQGALATTKLPP